MFASNTTQVSEDANYIESVFQTHLYTGTGAAQTIINGIDLSGKGGMIWFKDRTVANSNRVFDTVRGASSVLTTNITGAAFTSTNMLTAFNSNGFSVGIDTSGGVNDNGDNLVSWTFRKQPKFFDVVTGTADSSGNVSFSHSLGSEPGFVVIKSTTNASQWFCYHRSLGTSQSILLNTTSAAVNQGAGFVTSTATTFSMNIGFGAGAVGFVAYLFAHNAGGFGLTGTDNVISCGSFTTDGSGNATVNLGYEPQWVLVKNRDVGSNWYIADTMRGFTANSFLGISRLYPNLSAAEDEASDIYLTSTGFAAAQGSGPNTYIYIAIRRGPMKVPTSGTSVFNTILQTPQSSGTVRTVGFPADLMIGTYRSAATPRLVNTRLIGYANNSGASQNTPGIQTQSTNAESNQYPLFYDVWNTTAKDGDYIFGSNGVNWMFGRAPSFFDEVCYSGDSSSNRALSHNLGVTPELIICRSRSNAQSWITYTAPTGLGAYLILQTTGSVNSNSDAFPAVSSTTFTPTTGTAFGLNDSGRTYVAYLFATCAGVSKVTSFTGNGSTQTINCGFTSGARFVLIKATSTTGNWLTFDTARGMTTSTDPWLALNSTAAESATTGACTTTSVGFTVDESKLTGVNTNGVSYIALAVA